MAISIFGVLRLLLLVRLTQAIGESKLGIRATPSFFNTPQYSRPRDKHTGRVHYGSIVHIQNLHTFTDGQIVHLLLSAHNDMIYENAQKACGKWGAIKREHPPSVMTALVVDDTVYFSSSMLGGTYLYLADWQQIHGSHLGNRGPQYGSLNPAVNWTTAQEALKSCQLLSVNYAGHRNGACCGEPLAAMAYFLDQGHDIKMPANAKIVSSLYNEYVRKPRLVTPCNHPKDPKRMPYQGAWGCHEYTFPMYVISDKTEEEVVEVPDSDITIRYATYP